MMDARLAAIEARLTRLEAKLGISPPSPAPLPAVKGKPVEEKARTPTGNAPLREESVAEEARLDDAGGRAGAVLGWVGGVSLVLAASYLIQLALDHGWLTPARQLGLAMGFSAALVSLGFALKRKDRVYAGYLPAMGVVVLFLTVYGAHLYYGMIGAWQALAGVSGVNLLSLWLRRRFDSNLYDFFAVIGSYSAPMLIRQLGADAAGLAVYYSAWSILFATISVWSGRRAIHVLALYLALVGFDLVWRMAGARDWGWAALYQLAQLAVFGGGVAAFSVRLRRPLSQDEAIGYLPALAIFYFLEYGLLHEHMPSWAPWVAAGSAIFLLALALAGRVVLGAFSPGARFLVTAYGVLVLFHAGYLELLPAGWAPWVGLLVLPLSVMIAGGKSYRAATDWPLVALGFLVFGLNLLRTMSGVGMGAVPGRDMLTILYPAELYAGYALTWRWAALRPAKAILLIAGHLAAMSAAGQLLGSRLAVSGSWAALAMTSLALAPRLRDRLLARSSLFIFAVSALKVFLYDLHAVDALTRVWLLVVLGASLYAGGWFYRRLDLDGDA